METKLCPECLSEIPDKANVCAHCGSRLIGIGCKSCKLLSPRGATICAHCGSRLPGTGERKRIEPFRVRGNILGTMLTQFNLVPQEAYFDGDKVVVKTYGFLGLTSNEDEILWEKVAGFTHRSGFFWDAVGIETRGQSSAVIACLSREDALRIVGVLRDFEKLRSG